ncbi:hypothetical protein DFH29DRAFT_895152 [Suillus ampliporus]|nr:hypothetical protein DFH29DRAFT_895152 [Suillus ampliporus]
MLLTWDFETNERTEEHSCSHLASTFLSFYHGIQTMGAGLPLWLKFLDEVYAYSLLYTRSAGVTYFVTGAVLCSRLTKVIKKAIRQERPPSHSGGKVTYGYLSTLPLPPSIIFAPVVILPWTYMIVISRVRLGHHTWPQVAAGTALGACCASLWFKLWMDDAAGVKTTAWAVEAMIKAWLRQ